MLIVNLLCGCLNHKRYQAVFGTSLERKSMNLRDQNGASVNTWDLKEKDKLCTDEDNNNCSFVDVGISLFIT